MAKKKEPTHSYIVSYRAGLNLRTEPSMDAEVIRIMPYGEMVTQDVEKAPSGWIAVKGGGFCMKQYLQ